MPEYTEQEVEMLARFWWNSLGGSDPSEAGIKWAIGEFTPLLANERRGTGLERALVRAAARLMREAREHGATEMREQALAALRALPDGTWGDERGEMSPWPDAIDAVKALKVPQ